MSSEPHTVIASRPSLFYVTPHACVLVTDDMFQKGQMSDYDDAVLRALLDLTTKKLGATDDR